MPKAKRIIISCKSALKQFAWCYIKCKMAFKTHLVVTNTLLIVLSTVQFLPASQGDTLTPLNGRPLPKFVRTNSLISGGNPIQAIFTGYSFKSCGSITKWGALVNPGDTELTTGAYSISFQVWRPSPNHQTDGCYRQVGYNYFENITLVRLETVLEHPSPKDQITVQPGDTIGFNLTSKKDQRDSIQRDTSTDQEEIWYAVGSFEATNDPECPFPVGTNKVLTTSTVKNPIISVEYSTKECPTDTSGKNTATSQPLTEDSTKTEHTTAPQPLASTVTSQETDSTSTVADIPNPSESRTEIIIAVAGIATTVLLALINVVGLTTAFVTLRRRRSRERVTSVQGGNEDYQNETPCELNLDETRQSESDPHQVNTKEPDSSSLVSNEIYGKIFPKPLSPLKDGTLKDDIEMQENIVYSLNSTALDTMQQNTDTTSPNAYEPATEDHLYEYMDDQQY